MADARITWTGGAGGWQTFIHSVLYVVNFLPDGPAIDAHRTGGRYPVGTLSINGGEVVLTIRPGYSLVVPDRLRPESWTVK